MTIGARDFIDKLLVEKYAQEQMDNHDDSAYVSKVSVNDMYDAMSVASNNFKTMLSLNKRLTVVCYGVVSRAAKYEEVELV